MFEDGSSPTLDALRQMYAIEVHTFNKELRESLVPEIGKSILKVEYERRGMLGARVVATAMAETPGRKWWKSKLPHQFLAGATEEELERAKLAATIVTQARKTKIAESRLPWKRKLRFSGMEEVIMNYKFMTDGLGLAWHAVDAVRQAYNEAYAQEAEALGLGSPSVTAGATLLRRAPKRIVGISLDDKKEEGPHRFVTQHGAVLLINNTGYQLPVSPISLDEKTRIKNVRPPHAEELDALAVIIMDNLNAQLVKYDDRLRNA